MHKNVPIGFAFDPEKEEGPHPDSDFEWWYHFGYLKQPGATEVLLADWTRLGPQVHRQAVAALL